MSTSPDQTGKLDSDGLPLLSEVIIPGSALAAEPGPGDMSQPAATPAADLARLRALLDELGPVLREDIEDRLHAAIDEELNRILTGALEQLRERLRERMHAELETGLGQLLENLQTDLATADPSSR